MAAIACAVRRAARHLVVVPLAAVAIVALAVIIPVMYWYLAASGVRARYRE